MSEVTETEVFREPSGKARRYHVRVQDLVPIGEAPKGTEWTWINVVLMDDHNHTLSELFRESEKNHALRSMAVVVPERKNRATTIAGLSYDRGWNACLDELARLNGKAVPESTLRQIALALNCLTSWDFHGTITHNFGENWADRVNGMRDELNALFGEGKEDCDANPADA